MSDRGKFGLSDKQWEILRMLGLGLPRKAIGDHFNIKLKTIDFHIARIEKILNVHGTAELVRFASENGLVKPGEVAIDSPITVLTPVQLTTLEDLARVLFRTAEAAANGKASVAQAHILCDCTGALIDVLRFTLECNRRKITAQK
jgi:DNA-binding CsgD family transcriptional regulator